MQQRGERGQEGVRGLLHSPMSGHVGQQHLSCGDHKVTPTMLRPKCAEGGNKREREGGSEGREGRQLALILLPLLSLLSLLLAMLMMSMKMKMKLKIITRMTHTIAPMKQKQWRN